MRLRRVWMVLRSRVAVYFPGHWRIRHALITCIIRVRSLFVSNFFFFSSSAGVSGQGYPSPHGNKFQAVKILFKDSISIISPLYL
jgi:hypothetical protein